MSKPNAKSAVDQAAQDLALAEQQAVKQKRINELKANALPLIYTLGVEAAKGEGGLTRMAHEFARLVGQGAFDAANADAVYTRFVEGYNDEAGTSGLGTSLLAKDKDDKSFKNQVRVLADFAKPAVIALCSDPSDPDAWHGKAFWAAIVKARADCPDTKLQFGSAYNTMARVARKLQERWEADQAEAADQADGQPHAVPACRPASEDDLKVWVRKDAPRDEKSLEARMDAWLTAGAKLLVKDLPEGDKFAKRLEKALRDVATVVEERNLGVRKLAATKMAAEAEAERKAA
jgi:hypothetical protein